MEILLLRVEKIGSWCCVMEIIVFSLDFLPQETGYKLLHGRMGEDAIRGNLSRYRTEHSS